MVHSTPHQRHYADHGDNGAGPVCAETSGHRSLAAHHLPEIRVRIREPGVPARIMEDRITRQLEEQLAITENATDVQSDTVEGQSSVSLSFPYGTDIDIALRDASTRLDRAKRFLPDTMLRLLYISLIPPRLPCWNLP